MLFMMVIDLGEVSEIFQNGTSTPRVRFEIKPVISDQNYMTRS